MARRMHASAVAVAAIRQCGALVGYLRTGILPDAEDAILRRVDHGMVMGLRSTHSGAPHLRRVFAAVAAIIRPALLVFYGKLGAQRLLVWQHDKVGVAPCITSALVSSLNLGQRSAWSFGRDRGGQRGACGAQA